jgi:putative transcriptional regulator
MYHYLECGLGNVWLKNGFTRHKTPYGPGVSIHNQRGLHAAIAKAIVDSQNPLSGAEFRFLRKELDMSQAAFASIVGKTEQAVAKWEKENKVPKDADLILRAMVNQKLSGDAEFSELVERFNGLDRERVEIKLKLKEQEGDWQAAA